MGMRDSGENEWRGSTSRTIEKGTRYKRCCEPLQGVVVNFGFHFESISSAFFCRVAVTPV